MHKPTAVPRPLCPRAAAKLAVLLKRTRQAKEAIEAALGSKLGRRVNIQGEVNQLL